MNDPMSMSGAAASGAAVTGAATQQGLPIAVPVEATGDARVDAALERLQELDQVTIEEHAEVFGDIHARLSGALGDASAPDTGTQS